MVQLLASRLVLLGPDGVPERPLPMDRERVVLGRSADSDVFLADPQVSRHHAEIRHDHGRWVLRDLGSTHGTTRGGRRLDSPVVLHHGDVIGLGPVRLRFEAASAEPPTMLRPPAPHSALEGARSYRFEDISVRDQHAGSSDDVDGVQGGYVAQDRASVLREVTATRTRARIFSVLGVVLLFAGVGTVLVAADGSFSTFGAPRDLLGAEVGGVPLVLLAAVAGILGVAMIIAGVVLHAVGTARRRDLDRRSPDPRRSRHPS
jgi:hypothetical protein